MALDKIIVEIGGKSTELDGTIAQLEKLGIIDKKNADQFKRGAETHKNALKETGSEVDRLENKMRNLAERLVAIFAVERIFQFASESVKAFEQAELSAKKLEFAIVKINGGTQDSFDELVKNAEELSKSLNNLFTPKQIQSAQIMLANFGANTTQIKAMLPKVLDLSRAMGVDLDAAMTHISNSLAGRMSPELRHAGIAFKDTGDQTKNLGLLMHDLDKFNGAAAASMDTLAGKALIASNNLEVMQETIGEKLAPAWEAVKTGAVTTFDIIMKGIGSVFELLGTTQKSDTQLMIEGTNATYDFLKAKIKNNETTLATLDLLKKKYEIEIKEATFERGMYGKDTDKYKALTAEINQTQQLINAIIRLHEVNKEGGETSKLGLTTKGETDRDNANKKLREDQDKAEKKESDDNARLFNEKINRKQRQDRHVTDEINKSLNEQQKLRDDALKLEEKEEAEALKANLENIEKVNKETKKKQEEIQKSMFETTKSFFEALQTASEMNVDAIDNQEKRQQSLVDTQKILAEKGLANDLAFEERRANELEKKKQQEIKKQKRVKELGIFLNSMEKFAEDNPKTALAKALGLLAATKAAEAVFAEEGGILGKSNSMSWSGRRHASGKDILVHAEEGEGILSRKEMNSLGKDGFYMLKSYLKNPLTERQIPITRGFDNSGVISRLESLEQTIKNKPEYKVEWDGLEYRLETVIKNGIKERMKIQRPAL